MKKVKVPDHIENLSDDELLDAVSSQMSNGGFNGSNQFVFKTLQSVRRKKKFSDDQRASMKQCLARLEVDRFADQ